MCSLAKTSFLHAHCEGASCIKTFSNMLSEYLYAVDSSCNGLDPCPELTILCDDGKQTTFGGRRRPREAAGQFLARWRALTV